MKKILCVALTLAMTVSLAACGGSNSTAKPAEESASSETSSESLKVALLMSGAANDQG